MSDREFKDILSSRIYSITLAFVASIILASFIENLAILPGFFILLPGFIALKGSISGSLVARIGSLLNTGGLEYMTDRRVYNNILSVTILTLVVSFLLGVFAYFTIFFLMGISELNIIYISFFAGAVSTLLLIPLSIYLCFYTYRKGKDPDDSITAYITSIGDVLGVIAFLIAVTIIC